MVLVLFRRDCIISYWDILCNYCIIVTILIRTIVEKNWQLRPKVNLQNEEKCRIIRLPSVYYQVFHVWRHAIENKEAHCPILYTCDNMTVCESIIDCSLACYSSISDTDMDILFVVADGCIVPFQFSPPICCDVVMTVSRPYPGYKWWRCHNALVRLVLVPAVMLHNWGHYNC